MSTEKTSSYDEIANSIGNDAIELVLDSLLSADDPPHKTGTLADLLMDKIRSRYGDEQAWYLMANMIQSAIQSDQVKAQLLLPDERNNEPLEGKQVDVDPSLREVWVHFKQGCDIYTLELSHQELSG